MTTRLLALVLLVSLAACRSSSEGPIKRVTPLPNGGAPEVHQQIDPKTGLVQHEWSTLAIGNQVARKHGKETVMRKDGTKEWEREWDHGKPTGMWRSWYANGQMRSEVCFAGPNELRPMSFWFDNGQRRMQGPAKDGVRCGHWKVWFANGRMAEEGELVGSRREGEWKAWSEDGKRSFTRVYQHDVRIGEREGEATPGEAPAAEEPPK